MSATSRCLVAALVFALAFGPSLSMAQTAPPQQPPSFEPSITILRDSLALNEEQTAKLREVFRRHADLLVELRERARKTPFSQRLQIDVQREQQGLRDDISIFLTDQQKEKLPRVDARLGINLPPGYLLIPVPPRNHEAKAAGALAASERLVAVSVAAPAKGRAAAMSEDQKILHLLNRITFGPRPGDRERVRLQGLENFIEEQLHPENIDDAEVERRLAVLPTLQMTHQELYTFYPPGAATDQRYNQPNPQPIFGRPQQIYGELVQQKLVRAVASNRQLQEVMTDFWFNHFNVFAPKGAVQWMVTGYERDVIRPNAAGKFRDLLHQVAESPAMLFYLDNWLSAAPDAKPPRPPRPPQNPRPPGAVGPPPNNPPPRRPGLNENYARELLELHTLGVDGGYTQKDVQEVARAFTGWTLDRPYQAGGGFLFRPWMHDNGAKTVLGVTLPAGGGIADGRRVLDILSRHPATARSIARKLCQRFVADQPPPALVERVTQTFRKSDGDIKTVLRAIFTSPEFYSPATFRAKVKSPLELVASALRALDGDTSGTPALHDWLRRMGEPLYQQQAPTGYDENSAEWMNTGAFLTRLNFGMAVAMNQIGQTRYAPDRLVSPAALVNADLLIKELTARITHTDLSAPSKEAVRAGLEGSGDQALRVASQANRPPPPTSPTLTTADLPRDNPRRVAQLVGVLLGTSEFQKK